MYFLFSGIEQVILEHGAQTPPPSPFSVQAFNRGMGSSGAQGFDYGISNNKGESKIPKRKSDSLVKSLFLHLTSFIGLHFFHLHFMHLAEAFIIMPRHYIIHLYLSICNPLGSNP